MVFLVSVAALMIVFPILYATAARPRPYSVTAIGDWEGFSSPSQPVLGLTGILIGFIYLLVVPGRPRWYAKLAIVAILALVSLNRIYLGVDHPTDLAFAIILGVRLSRSRCSARSRPAARSSPCATGATASRHTWT